MDNEERRIKIAKQLKRLCIAEISFRQAGQLAQLIIETGLDATDLKYGPMLAGMVITYAKNFVENTELGRLREPFIRFRDRAMCEAHHTAMIVRHKVYAHRDLEAGREFTHDDNDPGETYEVRIQLHDDGVGCSANVLLPDLPPDFLPHFVELCELQHTRAKNEIKNLVRTIRSFGEYDPGEYVVGSNFP
jgi:hypothetical protein